VKSLFLGEYTGKPILANEIQE